MENPRPQDYRPPLLTSPVSMMQPRLISPTLGSRWYICDAQLPRPRPLPFLTKSRTHLNLLAVPQSAYVCAHRQAAREGNYGVDAINNTGARAGWKGFVGLVVGAVIGFAFVPGIAQAESFSKLEKQGFDVGNSPKARPAATAESSRTAIGGSSAG
ncbi:hypothetical protein [Rhizobium leguminosarum]|uniref:hypothetical protein n=1 Tax=Rhizobium leguminosarum TaxID=384 RepID=UPI001FDFD493|nr:hypothetical protein [Rhizobium leguminosarum]